MVKLFLLLTTYSLLLNYLYCEHFIQVGVFRHKEEAVTQQLYLASRNYHVILDIALCYRVIVGPYKDEETANFIVAKLLSEENMSASLIDKMDMEKSVSSENVSPNEGEVEILDEVLGKLVVVAFDFLGVKYKYGGMNVEKGIDCSYFMQIVYKSLGVVLPRTSNLQFRIGKKVERDELAIGDLVFFRKYPKSSRINHVGLYIGNEEFIHASLNAKKVTISSLSEIYFKKRFSGARRPL
ncbi:MAG: NlpC/P60 family protein [Elusimicrobiota bacterium]